MAENNRNQGGQFYDDNQGWQENRNRMNRNNEYERDRENEWNFGNAGFGNDVNRGDNYRSQNEGGQHNRVNYIPDNDDNRQDYPSGGQYGNRNTGNVNQPYNQMGQRRNQWGNQWGSHYGASYGNQERQNDQGNYGGQSGWASVNNISGGYDLNYDDRNEDWRRGDQNQRNQRGNWYGNEAGQAHGANYGGTSSSNWNDTVRNKDDQSWWERERRDVSSRMSENDDLREPRGNRNYPMGMHRGKGPRGYQRSDERIREDVCDRLSDDDMLDASEIEVQVNGSEVILTGTVLSREAKRHAEDLAESISGVRNVENRIRVGNIEELDGNYTTRQIIRAAGNEEGSDRNRQSKK